MESITRAHARALSLLREAAMLLPHAGRAADRKPGPPAPRSPFRDRSDQPLREVPQAEDTGLDLSRLSPQEQRVLLLMSRGMTNRSIARALALSEQTIKNYLSTAFRKLGVHSRTEAAIRVLATQSSASAPSGTDGPEPGPVVPAAPSAPHGPQERPEPGAEPKTDEAVGQDRPEDT
ncbi:response regulator transcription factor [Streptomyces sp. NPDC058812]|uniref:response regulator transcription factor n=1 Tax=unclassified Streptomyces TaxID=2593676 RepID=UPI0036936907